MTHGTALPYYSDRLKQKLNLLAASPTALVEAPSGYGKTTAVREYLEKNFPQSLNIYWLTAVDEAPTALYRRFCAEIEKIDRNAGERLLKIGIPNAFTIGETCEILRSIECNYETWLVIDNFQFFCNTLQPAFFDALLEHGGKALHIVIITQMLGRDFTSSIASATAGRRFLHITALDLQLKAADIQHYYSKAGVEIGAVQAQKVFDFTNGWAIAVYLQLGIFQETGAFSDTAVLDLMERLIWDKLTEKQQDFFLIISPFETVTARQICTLLSCDVLPEYALTCLSGPFIRYDAAERRYEPHSIFHELILKKRNERGMAFERDLLLCAGDLCRSEGRTAEAVSFYSQAKDYERLLSLDFSHLIYEEIGNKTFFDIALDITHNIPIETRRKYPLSMLRTAWAVKSSGKEKEFGDIMKEIDGQLDETGLLRAEWLLLSAYLYYPHLDKMLSAVKKAAPLFGETCSQVILPEAPWAFGDFFQMSQFHKTAGEADREADLLEAFIDIYSPLTNGHGNGADALFRTELAILRSDIEKTEIQAHKAMYAAENKRQSIIQLGAAMTLAHVAMLKLDTKGWQYAVDSLERAAANAKENISLIRTITEIVRSTLLAELRVFDHIADWIKNYDLSGRQMLDSMAINAWHVHSLYLLDQSEITRFIGAYEAVPKEYWKKSAWNDFILSFHLGLGYAHAGKREKAAALFEHAAKVALPDGFFSYFAVFSQFFPELIEGMIEKKFSEYLPYFNEYKTQFVSGLDTLHKNTLARDLPAGLTEREHEVALLATQGLHNNEIASKLFVSESTVRTHLRTIFQKLDIDRRAKLAEKLK
ncbi:MAG: LuxR C-terminal-related transcriptional regulator [Treponema sp.]|nr:LuxR C-terminal-related transcriptional regulator [Treponema sp.]